MSRGAAGKHKSLPNGLNQNKCKINENSSCLTQAVAVAYSHSEGITPPKKTKEKYENCDEQKRK
jgi:hypothetical protein